MEQEGWTMKDYPQDIPYADFLDLVTSLASCTYLRDFHLADLLVFPPHTPLYEHSLVTEGLLLLQDKASCLPVACLDLPPGCYVLDSCAAPGMKTSQAAGAVCGGWRADGLLKPQPPPGARVLAVERSSKRAITLKEILAKSKADSVTTVLNCDFLEVQPSDYPQVPTSPGPDS